MQIYILTFNCGREPLSPPALAPHLFSALPSSSSLPSLLFLSLQELAPIAASFWGSPDVLRPYLSPILDAVQLAASSLNGSYTLIAQNHIGMTAGLLFARADALDALRGIDIAELGLGWGGAMGNKGAVGVRVALAASSTASGDKEEEGEETILTFVAAHLFPGEKDVAVRNAQWDSIVRYLTFRPLHPPVPDSDSDSSTSPLLHHSQQKRSPLLAQHTHLFSPTSHVFLAGDLNYRTSSGPPLPNAVSVLPSPSSSQSSFTTLLQKDQLGIEKSAGRAFFGFEEHAIRFAPTYKYSQKGPFSSQEETWRWAGHRWPSWCDRVLYLPDDERGVEIEGYTALPLMESSDHRPVGAAVEVREGAVRIGKWDVRLKGEFMGEGEGWGIVKNVARGAEIGVAGVLYGVGTWEGECALLGLLVGGAVVLAGWGGLFGGKT